MKQLRKQTNNMYKVLLFLSNRFREAAFRYGIKTNHSISELIK